MKFINKKISRLLTLLLVLIICISSPSYDICDVYAAKGSAKESSAGKSSPTPSPTPTLTPEEAEVLEDVMPGLSKFKFKPFEWTGNTNVGVMAFSIAESLYTITLRDESDDSTRQKYWSDDSLKKETTDFMSETNWNNFSGMYETIEISNYCKAILSEEVGVYADYMDKKADEYGFTMYKEIFKAMAQARFNEHKKAYENAKRKGKIGKDKDHPENDEFDLFHIDGSWIDGGDTPVGEAKGPTPTPSPSPTPTPTPLPSGVTVTPTPAPLIATATPTATPMPDGGLSKNEEKYEKKKTKYTVAQSIDKAAQAFGEIISDALFPVPYDTNQLISVVEGFEYGGNSDAIKERFVSSSETLDGKKTDKFTTFVQYFENAKNKAESNSDSDDSSDSDTDYDSVIKEYAKVIAHGKKRSDAETYGEYKYSDQKFYQKVFENYQCSGGGSIKYGELPEDMKKILRDCMKTWGSKVTKERREIIQQGVLLYGVTYSMGDNGEPPRNSPSIENPKYLDCSSFTGQCYWRAGVLGKEAVDWTTGSFSSNFHQIQESELIPGDIGQLSWNPGGSGPTEHIGIYIGTVNGTKYWIHCTGHSPEAPGVKHPAGKGIVVNDGNGSFHYYGRCPSL